MQKLFSFSKLEQSSFIPGQEMFFSVAKPIFAFNLKLLFLPFAVMISEIKQISIKVWALVLDIFMFGYRMIKQLILPNGKSKGNILSSLFIFVLDIVERFNQFEHGFFTMAAVFKQRYVKQTLIIIVGLLFLLSSFEWTNEQESAVSETVTYTEQLPALIVKKITKRENKQSICFTKYPLLTEEYPWFQSNIHTSIITSTSQVKKYLIIHSLRI